MNRGIKVTSSRDRGGVVCLAGGSLGCGLGNYSQCRFTNRIHEEGHKASQQVRTQHLSRPQLLDLWWYSHREVRHRRPRWVGPATIRVIPIMDTSGVEQSRCLD